MDERNNSKNNILVTRVITRFGFLAPIIYKALFEYLYLKVLSSTYAYIGSYSSPDYFKAVVSWIVYLALYLFGAVLVSGYYKTIWDLFMLFSVSSSLSIYWLKDESTSAFVLISFYWVCWLFISYLLSHERTNTFLYYDELNKIDEGYIPASNNIIIQCLFIWVILSTFYLSYKYGDFRIFVALDEVSSYRQSVSLPTLLRYLFSWNTNIFIPLLISVHLINKKKLFVVIDFFMAFLSYAIRGNRIIIFTAFLILGIYIVYRMNVIQYLDKMIYSFLNIFMLIVAFIPKSRLGLTPVSLVYRLISYPAEAHYYYYDFFSNYDNPFLLLRQSILRTFFKVAYDSPVSEIIGSSTKYYLTGRYSNANNGLFSDAFQNFGAFGVIFYPILILFTLRFFIKQMSRYHIVIFYAMLLMSIYFLVCAYYFTWYFTGGLIPCIIICWLIRSVNTKSK